MPSVVTHPAVAVALGPFFSRWGVSPRWWMAGALCTVVPDLDTIGLQLGVPYGHVLGHRGLTHSLTFAAVLALLAETSPAASRCSPAESKER